MRFLVLAPLLAAFSGGALACEAARLPLVMAQATSPPAPATSTGGTGGAAVTAPNSSVGQGDRVPATAYPENPARTPSATTGGKDPKDPAAQDPSRQVR